MVVLNSFFFIWGGGAKKVVVGHVRWSSCTVTIVWELAFADSTLIVLDKWLSYRGGHISRFDCNFLVVYKEVTFLCLFFLILKGTPMQI